MEVRKINDSISVAPQIHPGDLPELAAMGFRAVICNRPDGEEASQPDQDSIAAAARQAGLDWRSVTLAPGGPVMERAQEFGQALDELPGPVLAYCRSGTRSATLWGLSQAGRLPRDEILRAGAEAGYDLQGIAGALPERAD